MNKAISIVRRANASTHRAGWLLLALLLCCVWSAAAMAQVGPQRDCELTLLPLSFGNYDPLETTVALDRTSIMDLTCRPNTRVQITFSAGSSGSFAQRTLRQGSSVLRYNIYAEAAHISILGDGTGGSTTWQGSVNNSGSSVILYGSIPPGQDPSVGLHSDSIMVTVTF
jgi:spore coat protein U-like protein